MTYQRKLDSRVEVKAPANPCNTVMARVGIEGRKKKLPCIISPLVRKP
jgi:hypothetical protein